MKRYILGLGLGLAIIVTSCGNSNDSTQPTDSGTQVNQTCSSFTTDKMGEAAGAWYSLYRETCLPPTATEPAKIKNINPDFGGLATSDTATMQSLKEQATVIIGNEKIFIYSSNEGSRIQPVDLSYIGDDFQRPKFSMVRPLVSEIFSVYGNPSTNLGKLRVLRDWVSRMAIHPYSPLHAGVDKNTHVLPVGWNWAMFDSINEGGQRWARDAQFWGGLNGYNLLRFLFNIDGTVVRPMMQKLGPAEYRIKKLIEDLNDPMEVYRTVQCSWQAEMLITLAASISIHGIFVSTTGHDTAAFFLPELAQWVYMDPTYNEDYIWASSGRPVSPQELYVASAMGVMRDLFLAAKIQGPSWERTVNIDSSDNIRATYLGDGHHNGWSVMGSNLIQDFTDHFPYFNFIQYDSPHFYKYPGDPSTIGLSTRNRVSDMEIVFPTLGVSIVRTTPLTLLSISAVLVDLASNWPYHDHFEIFDAEGIWKPLYYDRVYIAENQAVQVRSVDKTGLASTVARFEARVQ